MEPATGSGQGRVAYRRGTVNVDEFSDDEWVADPAGAFRNWTGRPRSANLVLGRAHEPSWIDTGSLTSPRRSSGNSRAPSEDAGASSPW